MWRAVIAMVLVGAFGAIANWWLAFFGGGAAGGVGEALFWKAASIQVSPAGLLAGVGWAYVVDSMPEAGETEYLLHVLHTLPDGRQQVYRANVRVKADGRLEVKAGWKLLGYRSAGGDW